MKLDRSKIGTVEVLSPQGVLADEDGCEFSALLKERLSGANPRLVVSLQEVPYMDSAALDGLVEAADEMVGRGARLKLVAVSPTCREILELTGLAGRFQFFEDPNDAVRSFL
ncbi:MAG: STAS domain-containing protein [Phycisphaerae bacterium]